ncbi:MAG: flavin reductase family protein [Acidimicrobiales bacterium]
MKVGLVGPFPPGQDPASYDRQRRRILWSMPSGLYVLGTRGTSRRNLMTLNWATQVSSEPKLIAVSVERDALSNTLISQGEAFCLNILHRSDRAVVRKFVKPLEDGGSGAELAGFVVTEAVTGSPILELSAAWLDCRLHQATDFTSHTLFVGEVVACGPTELAGDLEVLRMEDTKMSYGG